MSMGDTRRPVHCTLFPTPLGDCGIAWCGDSVIATRLPGSSAAATRRGLAVRTGAMEDDPPAAIRRAIAAITALLEGDRTDLAFIACDFAAIDPFEAAVYAATRAIPVGETRTYGAIALQMGDRQRAREVGRALGRNPFPIIVPCHRVIGANGKLTGFSAHGGIATKRRLLAIEGAGIGETPGLFDDFPPPARGIELP